MGGLSAPPFNYSKRRQRVCAMVAPQVHVSNDAASVESLILHVAKYALKKAPHLWALRLRGLLWASGCFVSACCLGLPSGGLPPILDFRP